MRITLLENRTGPRVDQQIGDIVDVDDREGRRMIRAGQAIETAVASRHVETATAGPGRRKVRR